MFRGLLFASCVFVLSAGFPAYGYGQGEGVEDPGWRASSERLAARIQALLEDLSRRMDELAALRSSGEAGAGTGEIEDMIALQRRLRMMELRQREAQIVAEMTTLLRRAQDELTGRERGATASPPSPPSPIVSPTSEEAPQYRIVALSGSGDDLRAIIWSSRAGRMRVSVGTRLPDGSVVSRIEADAIFIRKPGQDTEIPLGQGDMQPASTTPPTVSIGGPPPMMSPPPPMMSPPPPGGQIPERGTSRGLGLGGGPAPQSPSMSPPTAVGGPPPRTGPSR